MPTQTHNCCGCPVSRRGFLFSGAAAPAMGKASAAPPAAATEPKKPLRVQPVLVYEIPKRRPQTSWRPWGGIHSEADVAQEKERIGRELDQLRRSAEFPVEIAPLRTAATQAEAAACAEADTDLRLMYAAGGRVQTLEALAKPDKWNLMFLRHRSGPAYLWYEIAHPRFLRKTVDEYGQPGFTNDDVVVDKLDEVTWRLRALHGLRRTQNRRILAIGGGAGWGAGGKKAPQLSLEKFQIRIEDVGYPYLGELIQKAMADPAIVRQCKDEAAGYLKQPGIKLETGREFVENAFVLRNIFVELMRQAGADALTVNNCMSTIMPLAKTTACLTLSLLNDDGYLAFCESDFVVIPSGILLNAISGKPVFLNDPTHPHDGLVTLAHCTAPRKNDGVNADPAILLTHFESDYGAAPKVEMRQGQKLTVIDPDFGFKRWLGFSGEVVANPFLPICRSQIDVGYTAGTRKMLEEMRGFHWMSCYGDYRKEVGYALQKAGIDWLDLG